MIKFRRLEVCKVLKLFNFDEVVVIVEELVINLVNFTNEAVIIIIMVITIIEYYLNYSFIINY